mgnify:CR=1 FL=1
MLTSKNIMASSKMAALQEKMDKENTMKELKEQAKGLGITSSHYPKKAMLVEEITRVILNNRNESEKAQVPRNMVAAIETYLTQDDRQFGVANICDIESEIIVTGKEHTLHRKEWNRDMQTLHPEIHEQKTNFKGEEYIGLKASHGASFALISSMEDEQSYGQSMFDTIIDTSAVDAEFMSRLSRPTSSGLYNRADVEAFVTSLNEEAIDGITFGFIMTDGVDECAQWTLYDIVTCPEDEKVTPNGCFKIEANTRRTKAGNGKIHRSHPDTNRVNSVSMGMLTQSQRNFENNQSSWFANALAFKHNVLARLGLMQFATNRNDVDPLLAAIVTQNLNSPMQIEDMRALLSMAFGGEVVESAQKKGWTTDYPYVISIHKSGFKGSSRTAENAKHNFVRLDKTNIADLSVKSLILPFLEVAGFTGASTTMDILAQENRTGDEPLALSNISYLMGAGRAAIEADSLHEESDLVSALTRLEEGAIFRPYGVTEGYQLISKDATRKSAQTVRTHLKGKTGKNESHLQVQVREFAGETTICLLAVPYGEKTMAKRAEIFKARNARRSS